MKAMPDTTYGPVRPPRRPNGEKGRVRWSRQACHQAPHITQGMPQWMPPFHSPVAPRNCTKTLVGPRGPTEVRSPAVFQCTGLIALSLAIGLPDLCGRSWGHNLRRTAGNFVAGDRPHPIGRSANGHPWIHDVNRRAFITNFDFDDKWIGKECVRPDQTRHYSM